MADTIELSSFSAEIQKILKEYGEEVQMIADIEVVSVTKEAVKMVKERSPKKTGEYAKGWKMKKKDTRFGVETTIYNSTHGWLAHILENGYEHPRGGHIDGKEHVKPTQEWAEKETLKRIKEKL